MVIEARESDMTPKEIAQWLEGRMPNPVDDAEKWNDGIFEEKN
ncbi:MAG: hypothetical protein SGJ17_14065 [Hyphomicrobiales bacterium]|nr:hypothetical protein [Hyphomicrobiales bacterium]